MRHSLRKIAVVIGAICLSFAAKAGEPVRWLETTHNFGAFDENDGTVTCAMKFVNESTSPVIITQVHVTCGCTSPSFDKRPIAPGDTGTVLLSYNPTGRPGRFEKKVYVDLNTNPKRYTLYIKGSVIGSPSTVQAKYPEVFGPLRLRQPAIMFGEVDKGRSKSYFLEVNNASADTLVPKWVDLPPYVSVGATNDSIFPGENGYFTFMLASDKVPDYGLTADTLKVRPSGASAPQLTLSIPMTVMVNEDFSRLTPGQRLKAPSIATSESSVNFETIRRSQGPISKTFTIRNDGENPLIVRRIYTADKGIAISAPNIKLKKGKSEKVTVTVDPSVIEADVLNGRVVIISNDPGEPVLSLRVVGEIVP